MQPDNIPAELRQLDRWVAFDGKDPLDCRNGRVACTIVPKTWATFEAATRFAGDKGLSIAFVLAADSSYTVIEIGKCRNPATGTLTPDAETVVKRFATYGETYASGSGTRLIVRGNPPVASSGARKKNIGMYDRLRAVPMSGAPIDANGLADGHDKLVAFARDVFGPTNRLIAADTDLSDQDVLDLARREHKNFPALWSGDHSGYPSQSEAELALLRILAFWTRRDIGRMERLFGLSELNRSKWQRGPRYRERSLRKALRLHFNQSQQERGDSGKTDKRIDTASAEPTRPSVLQGREVCLSFAKTLLLKDKDGNIPERNRDRYYDTSFRLARKLQSLPNYNPPEQFEAAVREFCQQTKHDFEQFWYYLLSCWKKVKYKEGEDKLSFAYHRAVEEPISITPCPGEKYRTLASIAHHLAIQGEGRPFVLPRERVAFLLGTSAQTISNIVQLLCQNKVIKCVKDEYDRFHGKAKEYMLAST